MSTAAETSPVPGSRTYETFSAFTSGDPVPFPNSHYYLTWHWTHANEKAEAGQIGIRFDAPVVASGQALVDGCKAAVEAFWKSTGAKIPSSYELRYLRLAAIGTDGKYVPGSIAYDGVYAAPVTGLTSATGPLPLQVASVATLTTAVPRGQAALGRVYLPPLGNTLQASGRWTAGEVDLRSAALATCITALNGALNAPATVFSKGTVKSTAGAKQRITGVKIGTRPDVQRRRAKSVPEAYGATSAISGA